MTAKSLTWVGSARADIQSLPPEAQRQLGFDLRLVQLGHVPRDWKPMPSIGPGVAEIRVRAGGAFRLVYVAKFAEAVYVLHVFQKKSQKTSPLDLALARARFAAVRRARQEG
ncbi:MAG: type II toxin-antitoxin system RelE/ParE family toxin [Gemmatimonadaceae bacterium]